MVYPNITLSLILVNLLAVTGKFTFPSKVEFSEPIEVEFEYENATIHDYIGIYDNKNGDGLDVNPFGRDLYFYTYFCASQDRVHCAALTEGKGSVVFNGVDPSEENDEQWPLNPWKYKLCHMRQGSDDNNKETGELIGKCKKLKVKLSKKKKKKIKKKGFVRAVKPEYDHGEEIEISFDAVIKSQNSWIGISQKNNDEGTQMWVYTGCNNVDGDQEDSDDESNDCIKKKRKGKVTFGPDNTGRDGDDINWPPPRGDYYIRLNYYNNPSFNLYKEGDETFTVV